MRATEAVSEIERPNWVSFECNEHRSVLKYTPCTERGCTDDEGQAAGGRPTLYRREICDRLVDAMSKGLTAEAAAARIGISARSLFDWQKEHPEFLKAIQEGRQRSQLWWEARALAMANGEAGNTQIVMLGLRNRSRAATGWNNDTVKLEHTGPEGGPASGRSQRTISTSRRSSLSSVTNCAKSCWRQKRSALKQSREANIS